MYLSILTIMLAAATTISATLNIANDCTQDIYIYQSNNGGCDSGPNGICSTSPGAAPFHIPISTTLDLNWISNSHGTSVKISKGSNFANGILQFEYTMGSSGLYWDLSDLDGDGPGLVGTPFSGDNVKISPTGDGSGVGTCQKVRCPANQVCVDAYQTPDDADTRWCPEDTGTMWIDLCQSESAFVTRRAINFMA